MSEIQDEAYSEVCEELERLRAQHAEMLLKHARWEGAALDHLQRAFAEIERLINVIRATEMERDAGDKVGDNLRAEIAQLRDRIKWLEIGILTKDRVIAELGKAAQ